MPDEVSEEICPQWRPEPSGQIRPLRSISGLSGWPECDFTMPLVVEMPGKCPKCGGRLLKRTGKSKKTGKQYTYYCCEWVNSKDEARKCDFMTWDVPVKDNCPVCGWTMFKKPGKGAKKPYCINEACSNFTPEEKRGGWKPKSADSADTGEEKAEKKPAAKKTAAKKTAATKTATAKKTAAKKTTTAKKSTAKKSGAEKAEG